MTSDFELVTLKNGMRSLREAANGETFHPVVGPWEEASLLHVKQQRLIERAGSIADRPFVIWDVGLGAGANAIGVIEEFRESIGTGVELHSFDRTTAPFEFAIAHPKDLEYLGGHGESARALIDHRKVDVSDWVTWFLHLGDFCELVSSTTAPPPDAILYDPYSPKANLEMWTVSHFQQLRQRLLPDVPCLLTNYTRSTAVRVTLLLAGFFVGIGDGIGEKDQTTVASNTLDLLKNPLGPEWLKRVKNSTGSAPVRMDQKPGPIGEQEWELVCGHRQFRKSEV